MIKADELRSPGFYWYRVPGAPAWTAVEMRLNELDEARFYQIGIAGEFQAAALLGVFAGRLSAPPEV